jgi:hypothetical protein
MLTLTAVHDIMKISCLLPTVTPEDAPYHSFAAGEQIEDHDIALGYVLDHDASALPCYDQLPPEQRLPVQFTQER